MRDYAALEGRTVTEKIRRHCADNGHATHVVNNIEQETCPCCGDVLTFGLPVLSTWVVYLNNPADHIPTGDYHHMTVVAYSGEQAKTMAFAKALNDGGMHSAVWIDSFIPTVCNFDTEIPDGITEPTITATEVWDQPSNVERPAARVVCTFCGVTVEREAGLWVDALSGDLGGTFDHCTENEGGHRPAKAA